MPFPLWGWGKAGLFILLIEIRKITLLIENRDMQPRKFTASRRAAKKELGLVFDFANFPISMLAGLLEEPGKVLVRIFYRSLIFFADTKTEEVWSNYDEKKPLAQGKRDFMDYEVCYNTLLESLTKIEPAWPSDIKKHCLGGNEAWHFYLNIISGIDHSITASLPTSKLRDFFMPDGENAKLNPAKQEFDYACLAAYIAIRSIVGNASYKKITNLFILSRMDGRATCVESVEELSPAIQKYAKEYWMKRIKAQLYDSYGVKFYGSKTRGCYYSLVMPMERLVEEVEKQKASTRYKIQTKKYKDDVAAAKEKLLGKK